MPKQCPSHTKTYVAQRDESGALVCLVLEPGRGARLLDHWPAHSPDGFECGYGGSGPADLALAILSDHLGVEPGFDYRRLDAFEGTEAAEVAWDLHHAFLRAHVARWPRSGATIQEASVAAFIARADGGGR